MNTRQAYIRGFVKRAAFYGFNREEVLDLLKCAQTQSLADQYDGQGGNFNPNALQKTPEIPSVGEAFKTLWNDIRSGKGADAVVDFGKFWKDHPEAELGLHGTALGSALTPAGPTTVPALELTANTGNAVASVGNNIIAPYRNYQKNLKDWQAATDWRSSKTNPANIDMSDGPANNPSMQPQLPQKPHVMDYIKPVKTMVDAAPFASAIGKFSGPLKFMSSYAGDAYNAINDPSVAGIANTATKLVTKAAPGIQGKGLDIVRRGLNNEITARYSNPSASPVHKNTPYTGLAPENALTMNVARYGNNKVFGNPSVSTKQTGLISELGNAGKNVNFNQTTPANSTKPENSYIPFGELFSKVNK